jgi:hypothetical protein
MTIFVWSGAYSAAYKLPVPDQILHNPEVGRATSRLAINRLFTCTSYNRQRVRELLAREAEL